MLLCKNLRTQKKKHTSPIEALKSLRPLGTPCVAPTCTMKPFSLASAQGSPFRAECNPTPEHLHATAPHHAKCDRIVEPLPTKGRTKPFHAGTHLPVEHFPLAGATAPHA